jgi:hypothetical protein
MDREALRTARSALLRLRAPHVNRKGAVESSAILVLTIMGEEISQRYRWSGADAQDVKDSLQYLREMEESPTLELAPMLTWAPHLEAKLAAIENRREGA